MTPADWHELSAHAWVAGYVVGGALVAAAWAVWAYLIGPSL